MSRQRVFCTEKIVGIFPKHLNHIPDNSIRETFSYYGIRAEVTDA